MTHPTSKEINPLVNSDDQSGSGSALRYASDPSPEHAATLPALDLAAPDLLKTYDGRCRQALLLAEEAFAKTGSWVIFFREILGVGGIVQQLFPDPAELKSFMAGADYETLHEMLAAVRSQDQSKSDAAEPERMITIRIPKSLHELLQDESKACELSINKLAISKLLWPANPRFVPEQRGRRRGRRPGPQSARTGAVGRLPSSQSDASSSPVSDDRTVPHSWADAPSGSPRQ